MEDENSIFESPGDTPRPRKNGVAIIIFPLALAVVLIAGYFMGTMQSRSEPSELNSGQQELVKLNRVLNEVELKYVDTIEKGTLIESSIAEILQHLDPHSSYIPARDLSSMDEPLRGGFGGIGIRFMILRDTLVITNVIERGPSQQAGMVAGDRITSINDEQVAGIGLTNTDVFDQLKGNIGSRVAVGIYRKSEDKNLVFKITRGLVPIKSIESTQMITEDIGFIKLARFAETTPLEFEQAAKKLLNNGMKKLILDLRGNGGGYLHAAVELADQFLKNGKMIVYTEGRYNGRMDYFATNRGRLEAVDVAVLIDANTASASEIVAGAIQDNDLGIVLGRRSYGKGLVQEPIPLSDGSAMRLTIARYYTPTGRCIQKPYGDGIDYGAEYANRYENGEFYGIDSVAMEELEKFSTPKGRIVYGGGGIFPDLFIPLDTAGASAYLTDLAFTPSFTEFSFEYVDANRMKLAGYRNAKDFDERFEITEEMYQDFITFASEAHEVEPDKYGITASASRIKTRLKAHIAQNAWQESGWFTVFIAKDKEVTRAIGELDKR